MKDNNPKIKICGVKNNDIAKLLIDLDMDFIGLNFIKKSIRYLDEFTAKSISKYIDKYREQKKAKIQKVGLFLDENVEKMNEISKKFNLDLVQLCGNENTEYISKSLIPVIKVIHIIENMSIEKLGEKIESFSKVSEFIILDTYSDTAAGGTGKTFDWSKYKKFFNKNIIIAGGLNPNNINKFINQYNPWGIDVSSGVESNKQKDSNKINLFVKNSQLI